MSCEKLEVVVARLEKVAEKLESVSMKGRGGGDSECSEIVQAFDQILKGPVSEFVAISNKISPDVGEAGKLVEKAFTTNYDMMKMVSLSKKPASDEMGDVLKPISDCIKDIQDFAGKNFKSPFKLYLEAISGYAACFGWIQSPGKPHSYIGDSMDSGDFYSNRVLTTFKEKGADTKTWVHALKKCFTDLKEYAQEYHPTGCMWNPSGAAAAAGSCPSAAKPEVRKPASIPAPSAGSLFSELNKGTAISGGLKKVDDSLKTHKNPALRSTAAVGELPKKTAASPAKSTTTETTKTPVFELQGKKWAIDHQKNQEMLEITSGDKSNCVYMYDCVNTNVLIHNKLNIVTMDRCINCKVQLKAGLISSTEVTNCKKVEVHADDVLPFININSSVGVQVYLNDQSISAKISTSSTSGVNVCHWSPTTELIEFPVPELFVSYMKNKKLVTEISETI